MFQEALVWQDSFKIRQKQLGPKDRLSFFIKIVSVGDVMRFQTKTCRVGFVKGLDNPLAIKSVDKM